MDKIWIHVWKQRKLGEIIEVCSGRDYKHLEKGNVPVYGTGGYMLSVSKALSADKDAVGIGRKGTVDKPYILKAPFWTVDTLFYCVSKEDCDLNFIFDIFQNINWKALDESTGVPSLSKAVINKVKVLIPSVVEQIKIGKYFSLLDNRITFHHRKLNILNKICRYAWEQRKVTDLGEIYIGLVTTMTEHYTDSGHLLIRNSDIKDGYFEFGENPIYLDEEFSEQNKSRMHQLGDVITVHTGDIGTSAVIGENEVNSIGFATIVTRPNQEKLDSNYFATYLNTGTHKQWAISMATGDGRSNYNLKDYTKLVIPIPEIEEQKKIAACIGNLNNLITLHQQKYKQLQIIRKFMLKNMFL